jgi:hypothetical protein
MGLGSIAEGYFFRKRLNIVHIYFMKVHNVTDFLKKFLGNGSVNTFQRATMAAVSQWTNVIARCWATVSSPMNSLARSPVTCAFSVVA